MKWLNNVSQDVRINFCQGTMGQVWRGILASLNPIVLQTGTLGCLLAMLISGLQPVRLMLLKKYQKEPTLKANLISVCF